PKKGALLIRVMSVRFTCALGKLLNRVRSASAKSKEALMLLLTLFLIISAILPFKKKGVAINNNITTNKIPPTIFKTFFFIFYSFFLAKTYSTIIVKVLNQNNFIPFLQINIYLPTVSSINATLTII